MLPSIEQKCIGTGKHARARVRVLAIRPPDAPEKAPIAWIMLERQETTVPGPTAGSVCAATITLSYKRLETSRSGSRWLPSGEFSASYDLYSGFNHANGTVRLSGGAVFLDLPNLEGHHIGTYLMDEIVEWARQWPEANVRTVGLHESQGRDLDARNRRNRFWERFGVRFSYTDPEKKGGYSEPMLVKDLKSVNSWTKNIEEVDVLDFAVDLLEQNQELTWSLESAIRSAKQGWQLAGDRWDRPFRNLALWIWSGFGLQIIGLAFVAFCGLQLYRAIRGE